MYCTLLQVLSLDGRTWQNPLDVRYFDVSLSWRLMPLGPTVEIVARDILVFVDFCLLPPYTVSSSLLFTLLLHLAGSLGLCRFILIN